MNRAPGPRVADGTPIFTIIDAARAGNVTRRLPCTVRVRSLYAGKAEEVEFREVAPYLVAVGQDAASFEQLVEEGWGRAWGVYFSSHRPFDEVLTHLGNLLKVQIQGGEVLFFRFYDPRVLRVFLPTCTAEQAAEFFGPIQAFWVESEDPNTCLIFRPGDKGVLAETIDLRELNA